MENDRLRQIAARLEAATPGPWETVGGWLVAHFGERGATVAAASEPRPPDRPTVGFREPNMRSAGFEEACANAAFIAAAPTDIADLLGEVERLREALGKAQVEVAECSYTVASMLGEL